MGYRPRRPAIRDTFSGVRGTYDFPGVDDGIAGISFVEAAVASSGGAGESVWVDLVRER
ncbi:MAG: hypothetical protein ACOCYQ_01205 [Alkalispirochaeta sp.]